MSNDENTLNVGSNPTAKTIFPGENKKGGDYRTDPAQNPAESEIEPAAVKFPKVIRHRKAECK